MYPNPAHYFLNQNRNLFPQAELKVAAAGVSYFIVPLAKHNQYRTIQIQNVDYQFQDHHLSVYEQYGSKKRTEMSVFHYTGHYKRGEQTIVIHVYFDQYGIYLSCHAKPRRQDATALELSEVDALLVRGIGEFFVAESFTLIFQRLRQKVDTLQNEITQSLNDLEALSPKGVDKPVFKERLKEVIAKFKELHKLQFFPNRAQLTLLEKQLVFLQGKTNKSAMSGKTKKYIQANDEIKNIDEIENATDDVTFLSPTEKQKKKETLITELQVLEAEKKPTITNIQQREKLLNQLLGVCAEDAFVEAINLCKKLNALMELQKDVVMQACIDGDSQIVTEALTSDKENIEDSIFFTNLISTAAHHKHYPLFDTLFNELFTRERKKISDYFDGRGKNSPVRGDLIYAFPTISINPLKTLALSSFLHSAYLNDDLPFFCRLLNEFKQDPNAPNADNKALPLICEVTKRGSSEYLKALLLAKADPNFGPNQTRHELSEQKQESGRSQPVLSMMYSIPSHHQSNKTPRTTALHIAALNRYVTCFDLLMEYKADSTIPDEQGYTAFGFATYSADKPLNEHIIKKLLEKKHDIDERSGKDQEIGLLCACKFGKVDDAKLLLKYGANPLAPHTMVADKFKGGKIVSTQTSKATPLEVALQIKHIGIVEALIAYLMNNLDKCPHKEITRILVMPRFDKQMVTIQLLLPLERKVYNHDAVKALENKEYKAVDPLYEYVFTHSSPPDEERHSYLFNWGTGLWKAGNTAKAREKLTECLAIKKRLLPQAKGQTAADLTKSIEKTKGRLKDIETPFTEPQPITPSGKTTETLVSSASSENKALSLSSLLTPISEQKHQTDFEEKIIGHNTLNDSHQQKYIDGSNTKHKKKRPNNQQRAQGNHLFFQANNARTDQNIFYIFQSCKCVTGILLFLSLTCLLIKFGLVKFTNDVDVNSLFKFGR